jgi:hypothetical protein
MLADHPAGWNKRGVYSGVQQNGIIDESGENFCQRETIQEYSIKMNEILRDKIFKEFHMSECFVSVPYFNFSRNPRQLHFTVFDSTASFKSQKQDIKMSFRAACCRYTVCQFHIICMEI